MIGTVTKKIIRVALMVLMVALVTSNLALADQMPQATIINVNPDPLKIKPNGINCTNLTINVNIPYVYRINFKIDTQSKEHLDAKLEGPFDKSGNYLSNLIIYNGSTDWADEGYIDWGATTQGNYTFKLCFKASPSLQQDITLTAISSTGPVITLWGKNVMIETDTEAINITPVPELTTATLFGIGLIAVAIVGRKF